VSPEAPDAETTASVNVIFLVSGHIYQTAHEGLRTGRFTKAKGLLVIEVGVPDALADPTELNDYYSNCLVEAVTLAESYRSKKAPLLSVTQAAHAAQAARALLRDPGFQFASDSGGLHPGDLIGP
jgi:hypothetical protein